MAQLACIELAAAEPCGHKARTLYHLSQQGLSVPRSWVLEGEGLRDYLQIDPLRERACFADRDEVGYRHCHAEAQSALALRSFPVRILASFLLAAPEVDRWIVRSNHSCEDSSERSFAGLFRSSVASSCMKDLVHAIKAVAFQPYRWEVQMEMLRAGIDPFDFCPGILIQPFVHGRCSGVFFSRNPSQPWAGEQLCEWLAGDAKGVVDGSAPVRRVAWKHDDTPEDAILAQVKSEGNRIAGLLGSSVDCEWVWDGQCLNWVQARPIANLHCRLADRLDPKVELSREDMKERFPEPLSRMGWSVLERILEANLKALHSQFGLLVPPIEQLVVSDAGAIYSNRAFFQLKGVQWDKSFAKRFLQPKRVLQILGGCLRHWNSAAAALQLQDLFMQQPLEAICGAWEEEAHLTELNALAKGCQGDDAALLQAFEGLERLSQHVLSNDMATFVLREVYYRGLKKVLGSDAEVQKLINRRRTLNHELFQDCEDLRAQLRGKKCRAFVQSLEAGEIRTDLLPTKQAGAWDSFMQRWGDMNDSWDVLLPAWREDPRRLAAILQGESTARPAVEETHQPNPKVRRCGLEGIVEKFVRIVKTDDAEHLFGGRLLAVARSLILEAGRRLVSHGVLTKVHQVFGLTVEEVKRCLADPPDYSMAPYAQEHLRILDRMRSRTLPHFLNRRDPIDHISDSGAGVPVSAGCVEGQLRIVRTVEDLQDLSADTILALVSPNPAYIPFFSQVGGLVCETGGLLSHSFVVARELMLPAVTQVKGLTRHYKSGDRVRMDGATGQLKKVACDA